MNHQYLNEGEQTKLTSRVYRHADRIKRMQVNEDIQNMPQILKDINKTSTYINCVLDRIQGYRSNPQTREQHETNEKLKEQVFRKRDLDTMLKEGYYPTCSDIGVLFRGLMVAQGYPTSYLETFHEDYILDRSFHGHVFARVYRTDDSDKSLIVNPLIKPKIHENEEEIFPYIIFREGLDSWDVGIRGFEDMHRLKAENLKDLLKRYELNLRKDFHNKTKVVRDRLSKLE